MDSRLACLEEELTCPVCCDIFKRPVLLSCSHSFCKDCLQECWTGKATKECTVCKARSSSDHHPPTNLVLNLCEKNLSEEKHRSASLLSSAGEKLSFFCLDDEQPARGHRFSPIGEASGRCKQKVEELLKEKLEVFDRVKTNYNLAELHIKVQARNTEAQIKELYQNLHQSLREEEEIRIAILRVEEEQNCQEIKERIEELNRDMATLSDAIQATDDRPALCAVYANTVVPCSGEGSQGEEGDVCHCGYSYGLGRHLPEGRVGREEKDEGSTFSWWVPV